MGKIIDLVGQRFNRLSVLEEVGRDRKRQVLWKCLCDCGNTIIVCGGNLKSGNTKSCGCLRREEISDRSRVDLKGWRFERLLVLEFACIKDRKAHWKCLCDCGNILVVSGTYLRIGHTKSCGCLQKERASEANSGEGNPNYNVNLTDEERQIKRKYPEYKEWRKAVYERDNYICQCCNKCGGKLAAHHLDGYDNFPESRMALENGITLCDECHKNFHHQYGYGNNTREQFEKFLFTQKK